MTRNLWLLQQSHLQRASSPGSLSNRLAGFRKHAVPPCCDTDGVFTPALLGIGVSVERAVATRP